MKERKMKCNDVKEKSLLNREMNQVQMSKSKEIEDKYDLIRQAMQVPEIAIGLAMRTMALMKERYLEAEIKDFPCLVYYGESGCGKSTIANAIIESADLKINAWDGNKRRREKLANIHGCQLVLVDDINGNKGGQFSAKIRDNINEIARETYSGEFPCCIVTMEENALFILNQSAKSRMIFCDMNDFLGAKEKAGKVHELRKREGKKLLNEFFAQFYIWLENTCSLDWISEEWEKHENVVQQRNQILLGPEKRRLDEQWLISLSIRLLAKYLKIETSNVLEQIKRNIFEKKPLSFLSREDMLSIVYADTLKEMGKNIMMPEKRKICEGLWNGCCSKSTYSYYREECFGECCDCNNNYYSEYKTVEAYVPSSCCLFESAHDGVLFERMLYLLGIPSKFEKESILVVRFELLLNKLNDQFQKFCVQNRMSGVEKFSAIELKRFLYQTNRCLYTHRVDKDGKSKHRVQFAFLVEKDGEKVIDEVNGFVWLRVDEKTLDYLKKQASVMSNPKSYGNHSLDGSFIRMIKRQMSEMSLGLGEIGKIKEYLLEGTEYVFEQ